MCGVAGFLDTRSARTGQAMAGEVERMTESLRHRGPDDEGSWVDAAAGIALGHRRLSVIDLSAHGRQPMVSSTQRYVLTYNGEIYNFGEIRDQLETAGHRFEGRCDTEVMLSAIERWGLTKALGTLNGMFAFALWDRETAELHLARDRLGEKPMYYGWSGPTFLFGSELKALRAHRAFSAGIDRAALALYLRHNSVPTPRSIYTGISKLLPGTTVTVSASRRSPVAQPFWSMRDVVEEGLQAPFRGTPADAVDELDRLLTEAVGMRMQADVPLGAFLSGGIDSSLVVALMQSQSPRPVRTFTIGFETATYDESADAARVARHLGTDHVELRVTPDDALGVIPLLPVLYDEPFADCSEIPTYLVSQLARKDVTVSLSGDGGDELFGGYNRYTWCPPIWSRIRRIPRPLRSAGAAVMTAVPPRGWDSLFRRMGPALPSRARVRMPSTKVQKLAEVLAARGIDDMYLTLSSHWKEPASVVLGAGEPPTLVSDPAQWPAAADAAERMMYVDAMTYLPDDILTKLDRASMGVSLEARVPFLDHRVVEFAWRIPLEVKVRSGEGKWPLRQVLHRYVPAELVERPKMGFGLPIDEWLRGPLREWAEALLDESRLRREGYFDPVPVRAVWAEHLDRVRDWQYQLWDVLMFQAWLEAG